jgi:AcrR family transcriptional regulator
MTTASDRADQSARDKFAARRRLLAEAALSAISERGYANTGLREIADHSPFSHGSLHYYFEGKDDLVAQAVWQYKSECARRYDDILVSSTSADELARRVSIAMRETLLDEASLHRLWYDLRNQSMFDTGFGDTIARVDLLLEEMIWAVVTRCSELAGRPPAITSRVAYSLFDGLFLNALVAFLRGDTSAPEALADDCRALIAASVA